MTKLLRQLATSLFLLGLWPSTGLASADVAAAEEMFFCGLHNGCMADFAAIRSLASNVVPILKRAAAMRSHGPNVATQNLEDVRARVVALKQALGSCNRDVLLNCRADVLRANHIILKKVKFLTNSTQQADFEWDEANKRTYVDAILRKVCSGSISLNSIEQLDGIFFWNTPCTGTQYPKEIGPFQKIPGIESLAGDDMCMAGRNVSLVVTNSDGSRAAASFVLVNSGARTAGLLSKESVVNQLDETLVHEFVHRQREIDPRFKKVTDEFLSFRFQRLQNKYLVVTDQVEADINAKAHEIARVPQLTDEERSQRVLRYAKDRMDQLRDWIVSAKIPVRVGMASINGSWSSDPAKRGNPGQYSLGEMPTFKNGNPTVFKFVDWARSAKRNVSGVLSVAPLDSYSLVSEEEYVAVSLAMYRYDWKSAQRSFSKEELSWLEKNWEFGFLQR